MTLDPTAGQGGNGHRPPAPTPPGPLEPAPLGPPPVAEGLPPPPLTGPPGSAVFTLEGRPAPGLYFAAWGLSALGIALIFVALQTQAELAGTVLLLLGMLSLDLGFAMAAGYQVIARRRRAAHRYRGPSPFLLLGIYAISAALVSGVIGRVIGSPLNNSSVFALFSVVLLNLSATLTVVVFVRRTSALTWNDMGWPTREQLQRRRVLTDIGYAAGITIPATMLAAFFAALLAQLLQLDPTTRPVNRVGGLDEVSLIIAAVILAPIGEEIFFRGFALTGWHRDLGATRALLRSTIVFAAVHIINVLGVEGDASLGARWALLQFLVILPVGYILGWLFQQRGIIASIAGHAAYNSIIVTIAILAQRAVPLSPA